jgi:hypothetical protein
MSKKHFLMKKSLTVMRTIKKIKNVFAYYSRTDSDISKIPTDFDSAGQKQLS